MFSDNTNAKEVKDKSEVDEPLVEDPQVKRSRFRKELETLINHHSMENGSDSPDFLLAEYLSRSLELFDDMINLREEWYGRSNRPEEVGRIPIKNDKNKWKTFKTYKSLPTTVQAAQFTDKTKDQIYNELIGAIADFEDGEPILKINTIHGETAIVRFGDWVVKESEPGRYYPIKNSIFRSKYVEES